MKLDKYTVMFIPEGEASTHSYHFSLYCIFQYDLVLTLTSFVNAPQ